MNEEVPDIDLANLPDLGPGVCLVPLPDTTIEFDGDYLASQKLQRRQCSSGSDFMDSDGCENEIETGGGIERLLWPPELLLQAGSYGGTRRRKRNSHSTADEREGRGTHAAVCAVERMRGAGISQEGDNPSDALRRASCFEPGTSHQRGGGYEVGLDSIVCPDPELPEGNVHIAGFSRLRGEWPTPDFGDNWPSLDQLLSGPEGIGAWPGGQLGEEGYGIGGGRLLQPHNGLDATGPSSADVMQCHPVPPSCVVPSSRQARRRSCESIAAMGPCVGGARSRDRGESIPRRSTAGVRLGPATPGTFTAGPGWGNLQCLEDVIGDGFGNVEVLFHNFREGVMTVKPNLKLRMRFKAMKRMWVQFITKPG